MSHTSVPSVPSSSLVTPPPLHLAIIPDGNRRWARAQGLHPWDGHAKAVENFRDIADWCREHPRISVLTLWCFSTENWKRDPQEVQKLMDLIEGYIRRERTKIKEQRTRFLHSGRTDRIPPSLAKAFKDIAEETKDNTHFTFHLALDYGGKDEVVRAVQRAFGAQGTKGTEGTDGTEVWSEDTLRRYLDHPELPDIDLIVRTSGEFRTSNFFLWQSAYAEWFFLEKHFPALTVKDLEDVLRQFDERQRRFGS